MVNRTVKLLLIAVMITTALVVAFAAGVGTTYLLMHGRAATTAQEHDLGTFWEAWDLVERVFYGKRPIISI